MCAEQSHIYVLLLQPLHVLHAASWPYFAAVAEAEAPTMLQAA
jgi:hypothetical protein